MADRPKKENSLDKSKLLKNRSIKMIQTPEKIDKKLPPNRNPHPEE